MIFDTRLGPQQGPAQIALVVYDAPTSYRALDSLAREAREAAALVCIVQTKLDLIQRDFSQRHLFLEKKFGAGLRQNTDYVCISTTSKEA